MPLKSNTENTERQYYKEADVFCPFFVKFEKGNCLRCENSKKGINDFKTVVINFEDKSSRNKYVGSVCSKKGEHTLCLNAKLLYEYYKVRDGYYDV